MRWNWELENWPYFSYQPHLFIEVEKKFLLGMGCTFAYLESQDSLNYNHFAVEILSAEGANSALIEGEILDRESLRSSIKQHFGLKVENKHLGGKEAKMANLLCDVYASYQEELTHDMLYKWHAMLFDKHSSITDRGKYRTHSEPMQIISNRHGSHKVYFEAPPSSRVFDEMSKYIEWFNSPIEHVLVRAAIAHVYFECIHPFEDGNGRIGRVLVEKLLSQAFDQPILIAVSRVLERQKKDYYSALERCNKTLEMDHWVDFFAKIILEAQEESIELLRFLIEKTKLLTQLEGQLNPRQQKVLLRIYAEGLGGFKGGLSAENYIAITKTSRATATRDLADLVEKGALVKTGELRHTRYWLKHTIHK